MLPGNMSAGSTGRRAAMACLLIASLAGCKPRLDSADPDERQRAVAAVQDQAVLAKIATADAASVVRRSAVNRLTDQTLAAKIALEDWDREVRLAAVARLDDQTALGRIAVEGGDRDLRHAAVLKLTDPAQLVLVVLNGKTVHGEDTENRRLALATLTAQPLLARIAVESAEPWARQAALQKLTDQTARASVAIDGRDPESCLAAVQGIADPAALTRVALESSHDEIRLAAVGKLTRQVALARIAADTSAAVVGTAAVESLADPTSLAEVALHGKVSAVRRAAVARVHELEVVAKVAVDDEDEGVCQAAREGLADQGQLPWSAVKASSPVTRAHTVALLSDSDPALRLLAGNMRTGIAHDARASLARIRLSLREPRIRARLPRLALRATVWDISATYAAGRTVPGEGVDFELRQGRESLARKRWASVFPGAIIAADSAPKAATAFVPAVVDGSVLRAELLHQPVFTKDDLTELSRSMVPEVRTAAAAAAR